MDQAAAISRAVRAGLEASAYRPQLDRIIASGAFKGSRRSQEFLRHIVEKALLGQFDELKERALGVELFGRPASYDTGEDAIVRVTASDVRRRLHLYYADAGPECDIGIDLPAGSYIPEFSDRRIREAEVATAVPAAAPQDLRLPRRATRKQLGLLTAFAAGLICAGLALLLILWPLAAEINPPNLIEPWASIIRRDRQTDIIFCDPDVSRLQRLFDFHISLSDYANHRYVPGNLRLGPDMQRVAQSMRGVDVASVDAAIAVEVSALAAKSGGRLKTHTARNLQLTDFKSEDNFLILGSPRSNPWFTLFEEELDFRFEYDAALKQEVIRNAHPQHGETDRYLPTAQGWDTGHSYAVIAFVPNPGQTGWALLVAGSNAEATEAAGKLVTNLDALAGELRRHGINPQAAPQPFEALLRVSAMAGTSNSFEVVALHRLRH